MATQRTLRGVFPVVPTTFSENGALDIPSQLRCVDFMIYAFHNRLSDAIDIPIMVQDAPVSGTTLSPQFLARMAQGIEHVSYFKIETAGVAGNLRELIRWGRDAIDPVVLRWAR